MGVYFEQIPQQLSDAWWADKLYVLVKGDINYLFAVMDDGT
jgi:hypothetical protein